MNERKLAVVKRILASVLIALTLSCKSGKIISDAKADKSLSARVIIKNHYKNQLEFKTLTGRIKIDYSDGYSTQSMGVSLRMEKDKASWISAPLGVVKALITPDRVSFYNKLDNQYFDGDFRYLSRMLGTDVDFEIVQNLLLGQALLDLREEKYLAEVNGDNYELKPKKAMELFKPLFRIEPGNYKLAAQQLAQPWKKRLLEIRYKNYQQRDERILPNEIGIVAIEMNQRTTIAIEYRNMEFNRRINFPYKIPKGFEEIVLK